MSSGDDAVTLTIAEEARRLWSAAETAFNGAGTDPTALGEALDLGLRAAELLALERPQPARDRFPATIGAHHGWEDRAFSCRRSRAIAQQALGVRLDAEQRADLLQLAAYRNRLFKVPPPVVVRPTEIRGAFPALRALMDSLRG